MALWPRTRLTWLPSREGATPLSLTIGDGRVSADGIVVLPGIKGLDAPTYDYSYTESPGIDGAHLNSIRVPSREIFLPFYIEGEDRGVFLTRKRGLLQSFNPRVNGKGRLTITEGDSSERYIDLYYFDGLEGDEGTSTAGFEYARYGVRLMAFDPYFYGGALQTLTFQGSATALVPFFSNPFLGLHLMETQSFNGATTITTLGDAEAFPTWRITGPITSVVFTNITSGKTFTFNHSLLSGQVVTIVTAPGQKSAKLADGTNMWPYLGPNPQLWSLAPFANSISLNVIGTTSESTVSLEYRARYLSA